MINMGAKGILKRASKVERQERKGATLVLAPAYSEADLRAVKNMITEGRGAACAFDRIDRRKAVEGIEIMELREPSTLGALITRLVNTPTVVGPIYTLIAYKDSRRA